MKPIETHHAIMITTDENIVENSKVIKAFDEVRLWSVRAGEELKPLSEDKLSRTNVDRKRPV